MKIHILWTNIDEEIFNQFLIDEFRIYLKIQWLTQETILFYIKYIVRFIQYSKLTRIDNFSNFLSIKIAYNKLFDRNLKNSTLDKFRKSLIKYYNFLTENEITDKNYWKQLTKIKLSKSLPNSLSEGEINTINQHILQNYKRDFFRYRAYMVFNTIINTWVRRKELIQIKKENVTNQYIKIENWKWQKDRIIYISKNFARELSEYIDIQNKNNEYLFCTSSWTPLRNDSVNRIFKTIEKGSWVKVYPHLVRHTYASLCVKKWINIYTLQQQMGHTDLKTTSIYLYLNSKENWEEIQKLHI